MKVEGILLMVPNILYIVGRMREKGRERKKVVYARDSIGKVSKKGAMEGGKGEREMEVMQVPIRVG